MAQSEIDYQRVLRTASIFAVIFTVLAVLIFIGFALINMQTHGDSSELNLYLIILLVVHFLFVIGAFVYVNGQTTPIEGAITAGVFIGASAVFVPLALIAVGVLVMIILSVVGRGGF
jgi:hypothetical protein